MKKKVIILFLFIFLSLMFLPKVNAEVINILDFQGGLSTGGFGESGQTCTQVLGANLSKILGFSLNTLRLIGAITAIVKGMTLLIPPITSGDASALNKAIRKCIKLGIVLLIIGVFPSIIKFIGYLFKYDLTCVTDL